MAISKKEQQQWQAQDDCRTLALYQEIMQDKSRMNRAIKEAQKQAKELNARASAMNRVAKRK